MLLDQRDSEPTEPTKQEQQKPGAPPGTIPGAATGGAMDDRAQDAAAVSPQAHASGVGARRPGQTPMGGWRSGRRLGAVMALVLLVAVNLALQVNRRSWDVASDSFYVLHRVQRCESLGRTPDVLYLGSSRTVFGVSPAQVDATMASAYGQRTLGCNAGMIGSTFEQDYYTLKRFIEDGRAPKLVVESLWEWNVNIHAVRPADKATDHVAQIEELADLQDAGALGGHYGASLDGAAQVTDFVARRAIPLYGDRDAIRAGLCGSLRIGPCGADTSQLGAEDLRIQRLADAQGWIGLQESPLAALSPSERQAAPTTRWSDLRDELRDFTVGGHQPEYLTRLIALARAHGVTVVLTTTPLHPLFVNYLSRPSDLTTISGYWQAFARGHGVAFYDGSAAKGYSDADFLDPHHLSASGARKFSTTLATQLVAPVLAAVPAAPPAPGMS